MVVDQAALLNDLQQASAKLLPEADALLARYCALPAAEGADRLGKLWRAAELAQRRGRLTVAMGLLRTIDALSVGEQLTPLRRRALERAERLAYLQADLEAAGQLRERLRRLLAASSQPDDHALVKTEPLRHWRLELAWLDHTAMEETAQVEVPPLVRAACHGVNDPAVQGDLLCLAMLWLRWLTAHQGVKAVILQPNAAAKSKELAFPPASPEPLAQEQTLWHVYNGPSGGNDVAVAGVQAYWKARGSDLAALLGWKRSGRRISY
ncbi:hypothetical protein KBY86_10585 [Synechococcus sp. Lug-A]|uniref:hypothetical protein n=1 Tax=Synechococcus sp. Lug-A TaxID=2823740 RepID=UPI0020CD4D7D|nr:hypothetical protein [Synechococcus sp. Lug-A]MCP9847326.1 hypothetical protein [Synechococcus sp. Lug-A]